MTKPGTFRVTVRQKKETSSLENTLLKLNEEHKPIKTCLQDETVNLFVGLADVFVIS